MWMDITSIYLSMFNNNYLGSVLLRSLNRWIYYVTFKLSWHFVSNGDRHIKSILSDFFPWEQITKDVA